MVLLQHFNNVFTELSIFGAPESSPVIALGLSRPYLLDAVLAVSASHLRIHTCAPSTHRVAEHFQQSLALRNFQSALAEPLDAQGADALLLTGMLLNLLIFSITEDDEPASSWVFSKRPGRLNWLSLLLGYKPLLLATSPFHANTTLLRWMFEASDDEHRTFNGGPWSLEDVPSHWLELCGLNVKTSAEEHILYEPVRILAELRKYEPREGSFFIYQSFVGKLDGRFRDLLEASDYRAMWLLGYWMGLLRRFDIWWMRQLVSRDHRAVLSWLNQQGLKERGGREGQMWAELLLDLELAPVWLEDCRVQEV
jgi:hypothetical protein